MIYAVGRLKPAPGRRFWGSYLARLIVPVEQRLSAPSPPYPLVPFAGEERHGSARKHLL